MGTRLSLDSASAHKGRLHSVQLNDTASELTARTVDPIDRLPLAPL